MVHLLGVCSPTMFVMLACLEAGVRSQVGGLRFSFRSSGLDFWPGFRGFKGRGSGV